MDEITFLKDEINKLWSAVNSQREKQSSFSEVLVDLKADVKYIRKEFEDFSKAFAELKALPGQRWNILITTIITALTSGLVGAVITLLITYLKKG